MQIYISDESCKVCRSLCIDLRLLLFFPVLCYAEGTAGNRRLNMLHYHWVASLFPVT
jgi:hypothetical protein